MRSVLERRKERKKERKGKRTHLEGGNGDTNDLLLDAGLDGFHQNANDSVFPEDNEEISFPTTTTTTTKRSRGK